MIFKILVCMSGIADIVNICPPLQSKYKKKWQNILLYQNSDYGGACLLIWCGISENTAHESCVRILTSHSNCRFLFARSQKESNKNSAFSNLNIRILSIHLSISQHTKTSILMIHQQTVEEFSDYKKIWSKIFHT